MPIKSDSENSPPKVKLILLSCLSGPWPLSGDRHLQHGGFLAGLYTFLLGFVVFHTCARHTP